MQRLPSLLSTSTLRTARTNLAATASVRLMLTVNATTTNRVFTRLMSEGPTMPSFAATIHDKRHQVLLDQFDRNVYNRPEAASPEERWKEKSKRAMTMASNSPPAHAYSGRTVDIKSDGDLATAFRRLDGILSRNKVRWTLRTTERHEKPGVKRRRLSSERWRKRFANEVRKKVQLVMKIRDRGA